MIGYAFLALLLPLATTTELAPIDVHRRAVDFLEEQRDRDGSAWLDAHLDPTPTPLHTPGVHAPRYFEYEVLGPDDEPAGFIVVAFGRHDFPIVHARQDGPAPTTVLANAAGGEIDRIHRFGHGNYVAEDAKHREVARIGQLPFKVEGYSTAVLSLSEEERAGWYRAFVDAPVDQHAPQVAPELEVSHFRGWTDLRKNYENQRPAMEAISRHNAADDWKTEDLRRDSGETLQTREFRERPLLARGTASWTVRGEGRDYVDVELAERDFEGDAALRIWVHEGPAGRVLPVDIEIDYADGTHETLRLNVTDRIPNRELGSLPRDLLGGFSELATGASPGCSKAAIRSWAGTYLTGAVRGGPEITARGTYRTGSTLFHIVDQGGGQISLRAPNGKYVHVPYKGGSADATAATAGPDETFRLYFKDAEPGEFGLRSRHGYQIVTSNDGWVGTNGSRSPPPPQWRLDYCQPRSTYARWAGASFRHAWQKVRRYAQISPHRLPSTSQCASGCGATAWAMLFGFHDYEAWYKDPKWAHLGAFYLEDNSVSGKDVLAPATLYPSAGNKFSFDPTEQPMQPGVAKMIWEISRDMNDWGAAGCSHNGQKWTAPHIMGQAKAYLDRRVKVGLVTEYDGVLAMTAEGKRNAYTVIKSKRPVVIGTGAIDVAHYPLAIGRDRTDYRMWDRDHQRWAPMANHRHFVVHQGHQEPSSEIVPYGTWMAGRVEPSAPPPAKTISPTPVKPGVENPATQKQKVPAYEPQPPPQPPSKKGPTLKPGVQHPAKQKRPFPGPAPKKLPK